MSPIGRRIEKLEQAHQDGKLIVACTVADMSDAQLMAIILSAEGSAPSHSDIVVHLKRFNESGELP